MTPQADTLNPTTGISGLLGNMFKCGNVTENGAKVTQTVQTWANGTFVVWYFSFLASWRCQHQHKPAQFIFVCVSGIINFTGLKKTTQKIDWFYFTYHPKPCIERVIVLRVGCFFPTIGSFFTFDNLFIMFLNKDKVSFLFEKWPKVKTNVCFILFFVIVIRYYGFHQDVQRTFALTRGCVYVVMSQLFKKE